ncbi:Replication factor C, subunit RFC4 [Coemansia guatemalensis]|uniref:Replication factor C, subunit RFC4 n=1 Tax=Coemansia guatemalensis TaxID=2761395 RepID=A0A9W8HQA1_9FUNG|nr:Replication factor C, subunit RFC4 [Coemansia guatemalensis]
MSSNYASRQAEAEALDKAIFNDSAFAFAATFISAGVLSAVAQKFSPGYRGIPISAKTALILGPSLGAMYIRGEHSGTEFRRHKYLSQLDPEEREEALKKRQAMISRQTIVDRSIDFVNEHRWSILGLTWLAGITGAGLYLYKKKGMSAAQKLVEARMYAQLITVVGVVSTASIASLGGKSDNKHVQRNSAELEAILAADTKVKDPSADNTLVSADKKE